MPATQALKPPTPEVAETIALRLTEWFHANKRDLPWRGADPFGIWVSEIMLQQTQVATVIPYYDRFMQRFPTVEALAQSDISDVLAHWAGLGYYARARNLHRAAIQVVERFQGVIPDTREEILSLPGIGDYTSGAILSIAYNVSVPAVDANVIRVVTRLFGIAGDPKSNAVADTIRRSAAAIVPANNAGDFNQALMELGALVCDPAEPQCERCPLLSCCYAGNSDNPAALPETTPGKAITALTHACIVLRNPEGRMLLVQRPPHGLWGGLWEFPRVVCKPGEPPEAAARRAAFEVIGFEPEHLERLTVVKHAVTRFKITLHAYIAEDFPTACWEQNEAESPYNPIEEAPTTRLLQRREMETLPFSAPQLLVRNALEQVQTTMQFDAGAI